MNKLRQRIGALLSLILLSVPEFALADTRAAFVVGNSAYENAPALANSARDARLIANTLRSLDFEVTRHEDLSRDDFADALGAFLRRYRDADVTFFYFAGHGMQYEGQNYLVGTDAELRSELDIDSETIELDKVVDLLERNSKAALVFVDACRDNPLASDFYRRNFSETRALETRGLARMRARTDGSMLVFAAAPGQVAYDGAGRNSPFATALAKHLPTEGAEILSLTKRIIGDVREATDGRQSPIVTNDLTQEIFLREAALRPQNGSTPFDEEQLVFDAAKKIDTLHSWALYFEKYPSGRLRSLALQAEHEALKRELSHLSAGWDLSTPGVEIDGLIASRFESRQGIDRNDSIAIQALLKRRGHYDGPLDGALGPGSRRALRDFQRDIGLPVTGMVTRSTTSALGLRVRKITDRPSFSSHRMRIVSLDAAQALDMDVRLIEVLELSRGMQVIYGYRGDRLYIASNSPSIAFVYWTRDQGPQKDRYLVSINDADENRWVYELVRYEKFLWAKTSNGDQHAGPAIGLVQDKSAAEPRGGWTWASGEESSYRAWGRFQPDDFDEREDHAQMWIPAVTGGDPPDLLQGPRWNDTTSFGGRMVFEIE